MVLSELLELLGLAPRGRSGEKTPAELAADLEAADRIRVFCEEVQVAGNDYHARITAGQIVNLLAGRDANDDGGLLRC